MKNLTDICDPTKLKSNISSLNEQQRRLFDDFTERMVSSDLNEKPVYLFLAGNAGTKKSFLVNILIEAVKLIKIKAGDDLKKTSSYSNGSNSQCSIHNWREDD
jgi:pantothenate kinase